MSEKLYLIKCGEFYKIGVSSNPKNRIDELQTGAPQKLKLLDTVQVDGSVYALESYIHRLYEDKNSHGEWFKLNKFDLVFIKNLFARDRINFMQEEEIQEQLENNSPKITNKDVKDAMVNLRN